MYQVGYTKLYFRTGQIGALEDTRKRVLQSVTSLQKCFRGYKARTLFVELKSKISSLQSLIRGENARRKYESLLQKHRANLQKNKHKHKRSASKALDDQQKAIVQLQSVVRGWLARKHYDDRQTLQDSNVKTVNGFKAKDSKIRQVKDVSPADVPISNNVVEELQRWVARAETTLVPKEEENKSLRTQLQQYETRWSKYEAKMRSMEDMWQKQIASLQTSLAAARKSLVTEDTSGQPARQEASLSPRSYDSDENMFMGPRTPGESTPTKYPIPIVEARESNGIRNPVNHLSKEFEQQRQVFDEDARALFEVRSGQSTPGLSSFDELRRLKMRFESWKKEYKARLRETKGALHKLRHADAEKGRRKWWGKLSGRAHKTQAA